MKSLSKILIIFTILSILLFMISNVNAMKITPENFDPGDVPPEDVTLIQTTTGQILGYVQWAGAVLSVIIITIIGFKYILSSVEEKASYKENFLPLIVGIGILVMATSIPSIVYNLVH